MFPEYGRDFAQAWANARDFSVFEPFGIRILELPLSLGKATCAGRQ